MVAASGAGAAVAIISSGGVVSNRSFAGFEVVKPTKHITSASVTFVVPSITCHKDFSGVGPSVIIDSTVQNHHYSYSGGGVGVACQNLQPVYIALPIVDGVNYDDFNVPVSAGDKVTVSVRYGLNTKVTWTNDTTHEVDIHTGKRSRGAEAFFGDNGLAINHHGVGLDPFTRTSFGAARVNGHPIGGQSPQRYRWVDSNQVVLVSASALSHGAGFTTTFRHSD
jgi:hypothetical protein